MTVILPVGDSITDDSAGSGPGSYRLGLQNTAAADNRAITYVGSQTTGPWGNNQHEGHGGYRIDEIEDLPITDKMATYQPDGVLLLIGTNDCNQDFDFTNVASRYTDLLNAIYSANAPDWLLMATIPPVDPDVFSVGQVARTNSLNAQLPAVATAQQALGRAVYLVDINPLMTLADLADGVHPNAAGYAIIADAWYDAIELHNLMPLSGDEVEGRAAGRATVLPSVVGHVEIVGIRGSLTMGGIRATYRRGA